MLKPIIILFGLIASTVAAAQPTPAYISSMAPFEVQNLSGSFAPANGKVSMRDVTPAEWLTKDPGTIGLRGILDAWGGGGKSTGTKLYVTGGGHNDSANNGLYIFDFAGTDRPNGWLPPVISPVSAIRSAQPTYADGKPSAIHTYDGVVYSQANDTLYRFNGVFYYPNGGFTDSCFKFNVKTNTWTRLPDFPAGPGSATTIYDPVTGKIFVTKQEVFSCYFFRTSNDSWSSEKDYKGSGITTDSSTAWDSKRSRAIILGGGRNYVANVNFTAETISLSKLPVSGGILNESGLSVVYDATADVYWIFGGGYGSPGYHNIYEMNAQTFAITAHTLSRPMTMPQPDSHGTFGRFVFMESWRAIGTVTLATEGAYVIKLPGTSSPGDTTPPAPPAHLKIGP